MSRKIMKAAVLAGPKQIEIKELPVPEVGLGEMEIDVLAIGV